MCRMLKQGAELVDLTHLACWITHNGPLRLTLLSILPGIHSAEQKNQNEQISIIFRQSIRPRMHCARVR
ncbi:hypothetical protein XAP6164_4960006 [Xanthomonas phaseoli pv. phaseoli]|nr:hypothetical protein XAP6164_4960006 [Xanthomonas phaseoli pv. phaseoli]